MAANLHIGRLNRYMIPDGQQLMRLNYFDKTNPDDFGKAHYIGNDEKGNQVYVLGTKSSDYGKALNTLLTLMGASDRFMLVATMPCVNLILRLGGWLSRSARLTWLGRPLVIIGARAAFRRLCRMVDVARADLGLSEVSV